MAGFGISRATASQSFAKNAEAPQNVAAPITAPSASQTEQPTPATADTAKSDGQTTPKAATDAATAAEAAAAEADAQKKKAKLFSDILADMYKMRSSEEFNKFQFPDHVSAHLKDVLDEFTVVGQTTSRSRLIFKQPLVTAVSVAATYADIQVSSQFVKSDLSKLTTDQKAHAAIEMAMIAANCPKLMGIKTGIPLEGNDEEKLALFFAAQKMGFGERIDMKSLEGLKVTEEQQQKIMQAVENAWTSRKEGLNKMTAPKKEKKDFDNAAKPAPKAPDAARIKADFDQPIGGILNFYHQQYDKKAVEEIKTKLLALYYFEKSTGADILPKFKGSIDFKSDKINSVAALEAFMTANAVPAEFIKQAEDEVAAWKPAPQDFPKMGEIADGYRLVNKDVKNQLLTAQAVVRTMARVERLEKGTAELETDKGKTFLGHVGKFPDDPAELTDAQKTYALATVAEELKAKGIELDTVLPDVANLRKSALATLDTVITNLDGLNEGKAVDSLKAVRDSYNPMVLTPTQRSEPAAPAAEAPKPSGGMFSRFRKPDGQTPS